MPSMREYAAHFQIDSRRLGPRQLLMHPGPGQPRGRALRRGDRLAAVADRPSRSPPAWSCGWRSSTSCSRRRRAPGARAAGDGAPSSRPRSGSRREPRRGARHARRRGRGPGPARRDRARPRRRDRRRPRRRHPRRPDRRAGRARRGRRSTAPRWSTPTGLHAFPAFFDPHVHLRTPGQEHKEDIETGTRAAAAGGYCGVLAMANTEPPVSTAGRRRGAARARPARAPRSRSASSPPSPAAMEGEELTEMAELRDAGALGFSDDGLPIRSARVLRRALQYQRLCGGTIALHEEDPELSGDGRHARGRRSPPRSASPASPRSRSRR